MINELIADKAEIARIAQIYQDELVAQRISTEDITYITETVVPLVKKVIETSETTSQEVTQAIEILSTLVSVEAVNVLQILGFNYRQAIGEPLTQLARGAILSKVPGTGSSADEIRALELRRENLIYKLALTLMPPTASKNSSNAESSCPPRSSPTSSTLYTSRASNSQQSHAKVSPMRQRKISVAEGPPKPLLCYPHRHQSCKAITCFEICNTYTMNYEEPVKREGERQAVC